MESTIIKLLTGNPEPWQIAVGIVILFLLVIPRIISLRDSWVGYRLNRGQIKHKKEVLELLKLQYEIEALRKAHDLPKITPIKSAQVAEGEEKNESQPSPFWLLLVKHSVIGEILLRLLQGIAGLYLVSFGLGSLAMPFMLFFGEIIELSIDEEMNPLLMAAGWIFYVVLTYLLYKGYKKISNWIINLRSDARLREMSKQEQHKSPNNPINSGS